MRAVVASDVSAAVTAGSGALQLLASTGSRREELVPETSVENSSPHPSPSDRAW